MTGCGFGFGSHRAGRRLVSLGRDRGPLPITPPPAWTGVAGSGFSALPEDPPRTTAKPAMRLLVAPNQYFTDELVIGVYAAANDRGSLLENMGLERVLVHYEGETHVIESPSIYLYEDANGQVRRCAGWWIVLANSGRHGHAQVYFEAVPRDPAMQNRVIGPFQFSPVAVLHDHEVTVAATAPVVAGASYQTIPAALQYLKGVSAQNPRITIAETATYDLGTGAGMAPTHAGNGYCTIRATVPVTIGRATADYISFEARTRYDGMRFTGANITFDMRNVLAIYQETTGRSNWYDGVTFTNSAGRNSLWRRGPADSTYTLRGEPILTECSFRWVRGPTRGARLVRGVDVYQCYGDMIDNAQCVIGSTFADCDTRITFASYLDALTVRYTGAGASATLQVSGNSDTNNRVWTARVAGAIVGTFTVQNTVAAFTANTNYTVQNVADWLNGLAGWTATVLDDTRRATACGNGTNKGHAIPQTDVKTAPLTVKSFFDIHADWYQQGSLRENVLVADNVVYNCFAQLVFFSLGEQRDTLFLNNCLGSTGEATVFSQFDYPASHFVMVHNSWANQKVRFRPTDGFNADGYCLMANNVAPDIDWTAGTPDADMVIRDNHVFDGAIGPGAAATGTTTGGDTASLFVNAMAGDFTPAGALLANLKPAALGFGFMGLARVGAVPPGARASPVTT